LITKAALRSCISPTVAFMFTIVSITGFLMLFDIAHVDELHQWMGLTFAIGGVIHLAINWRVLVVYFRGRQISVWSAVMLLICAVLLFGIGDSDREINCDPKSESREYVRDWDDE
jgi:uncharacterized protein YybS (DUF2232 family)